ncbi:TATA box-binding protein-associated factor RNA polymerase I subunit A [Bulinus truncatus]|nr:TATA box-binding protein-associated factor RNA polymerase I subunit A [Bulinus truncatus]
MEESVCKMRDIFLILNPDDDSSLSEDDQKRKVELAEVLQHFNKYSKRLSDYFHDLNKHNFCNLVPHFLHLLRECLLTHQCQKALKLVSVLCNECKGPDATIWKAGLCCLFQDEDRNSRLIQQFVKQLYFLKKIAVVEVILDYLLYLLLKLNIEDAKSLVQELKMNTLFPSQLINERRTMAHNLFFAYQGLVLYVEWKTTLIKVDEEDNMMDIISQKLSQGASGNAIRAIADSAVEYLITIKDLPGVWDIFISRIVEIYEFYGNIDKARELLICYRARNPTNPNAHHYLYQFEVNQDEDPDTQLDCLKKILKLDPSNNLCLTLYKLTESEDPYAITYLFDYLDYEHCYKNEEVWEALLEKLEQVYDNTKLVDVVREQWEIRKYWWPRSRFRAEPKHQMSSRYCLSVQKVQDILLHLDNEVEMKEVKELNMES